MIYRSSRPTIPTSCFRPMASRRPGCSGRLRHKSFRRDLGLVRVRVRCRPLPFRPKVGGLRDGRLHRSALPKFPDSGIASARYYQGLVTVPALAVGRRSLTATRRGGKRALIALRSLLSLSQTEPGQVATPTLKTAPAGLYPSLASETRLIGAIKRIRKVQRVKIQRVERSLKGERKRSAEAGRVW